MFTGMKEILIQVTQIVYGIHLLKKRSFVAFRKTKQLLLYCLSCVLKIVTMNAELSLSPLIQKKRTKIH
jgi:hypothetical protein